MDVNHLYVTGNIVKSSGLQTSQNGMAYLKATVANNHYYSKKDGVETKKTNFIDFLLYGKMAEKFSDKIDKGVRIAITGALDVQIVEHEGKTYKNINMNVVHLEVLANVKTAQKNTSTSERAEEGRTFESVPETDDGNYSASIPDDDDEFPF